LRQRYREGQEDQLGALGLVVNIIVLWNTLYIDAIVQQLRAEGFPVQQEDVARLSPLIYEHINLLGRYAFSVPEAVQRGELRPLRSPADSTQPAAHLRLMVGDVRSFYQRNHGSDGTPLVANGIALQPLVARAHRFCGFAARRYRQLTLRTPLGTGYTDDAAGCRQVRT
jgi:Tn3 transposase DDE domain